MTALELTNKYKTLLDRYEVNTPIRLAHFWGQIDTESKLKPIRESLYYTKIEGLRAAFKSPFKGKSDIFVSQYLKNSEKCANYVYANRGGNGNEASQDGFKFRGGGYLQKTFYDGYKSLEKATGIPFTKNPDLILEEANSIISALEYWKDGKLNKLADEDNLDAISDIINIGSRTKTVGDANGFKERKENLEKYKKIFK
jgi:putative chitinase